MNEKDLWMVIKVAFLIGIFVVTLIMIDASGYNILMKLVLPILYLIIFNWALKRVCENNNIKAKLKRINKKD